MSVIEPKSSESKIYESLNQMMKDPSHKVKGKNKNEGKAIGKEEVCLFLKIIKKSGEEISGLVTTYNKEHLRLVSEDWKKKDLGQDEETVAIQEIESIAPLDMSYPAKFSVFNTLDSPYVYIEFKDKGQKPTNGWVRSTRQQAYIDGHREPFLSPISFLGVSDAFSKLYMVNDIATIKVMSPPK